MQKATKIKIPSAEILTLSASGGAKKGRSIPLVRLIDGWLLFKLK